MTQDSGLPRESHFHRAMLHPCFRRGNTGDLEEKRVSPAPMLCSRITAPIHSDGGLHAPCTGVYMDYILFSYPLLPLLSTINAATATLKVVLHSFILWVWVPWHVRRHKKHFGERVFSSHHVGTRDAIHAVRLGGKHLHLLCHVMSPHSFFLNA